MSDWESTRKCWCPAGSNMLWQPNDFDPCPICCVVERINALAESCMTDVCLYTMGDYYMRVGEYLAYIHEADIILESEEE